MKEISNRHFDLLIEKLPRLLAMARKQKRTAVTPSVRGYKATTVASRTIIEKEV